MRKRSGAMSADSEASYLKLAKLAQKSESLFYSDNIPFNDEIYKMDLEQSSMPEFSTSPNQYSPQQNLHMSAENLIFQDFEFNQNLKDEFQLVDDEKNCLNMNGVEKKIILNMMVLGDSKINKKLFVNSCFEENPGNQICNNGIQQ